MAFDVFIDDRLMGRGTHGLKKEIAHNRAAKHALDNIGRILGNKDKFSQANLDYPLHSNGLVDVPMLLVDIVESLIVAVFIDCNSLIDTVWKVFKDLLEPIISREMLKIHPVMELYEVGQKKHLKVKFVDLWRESMAFDVFIDDQLVGRGTHGLKKEIAHNRAAKDALDNIGGILGKKDNTDES
ncbi:ribonuclease 3-like protein 3 [Hevea brasiliensis]|uniref:ribonuclease 3-like protein 3 n=1 Tax=Hevea brasiliensis TaxID=3981 RepID=UPI0025F8D7D7|nr:ribonuclease 3-like protein 3 [Hevea brasiliensis]